MSDKYQIKTEIEHILDRPGTWVGDTNFSTVESYIYVPSVNKFRRMEVEYNPALHKVVDEVISNSIDEYRRSKQKNKESLFDISKIVVTVNVDGSVCVEDDGGIPVRRHPEVGVYVPYMLFGMLRTSSNYDDEKEREVVGTNGLGVKLTNIYSRRFRVDTADGKKSYSLEWSDNMQQHGEEIISSTKQHFTRISFDIDLERFGVKSLTTSMIRMFQKRCIDAAAANRGLEIEFRSDLNDGVLNSNWAFGSSREYIDLYVDDGVEGSVDVYNSVGGDEICLMYGSGVVDNIGFVNGALCCRGTHIKKIQKQVSDVMLHLCRDNDMPLITEKDILSRLTVFVMCTVVNPMYDSQTKLNLTSKLQLSQLNIMSDLRKRLPSSELFQLLKDFYEVKYRTEMKKELRRLNATIRNTKSKKYIKPGVCDPKLNELWVFEGDSANSGFRAHRNSYQSAYLLRGKILNTVGLKHSDAIENRELCELMNICRLQFDSPKENLKNFPFSVLYICTDMDEDGSHITGLMLAFFGTFFPEIIRAGKVRRALSPLIIATSKSDVKYYYSLSEFDAVKSELKGYKIKYNKGIGSLEDKDYRDMMRTPKSVKFSFDESDKRHIKIWFDKHTEDRKLILLNQLNHED